MPARLSKDDIHDLKHVAVLDRRNRPSRRSDSQLLVALTLPQVLRRASEGALIIDGRPPSVFAQGHIEGSINMPLHEPFGDVLRTILAENGSRIVLVVDEGAERNSVRFLARHGFKKVLGNLSNPAAALEDYPCSAETSPTLTPESFETGKSALLRMQLLDMRRPGEQSTGTIPDAIDVPVEQLVASAKRLDPKVPTVMFCCSGERSSLASSFLRHAGFRAVFELEGGFNRWQALNAS